MFPPAVPNDPLVPTAVLGEISDTDVYVTFTINKYPVLIIHHCHKAPVPVAMSCIFLWITL